MADSVSRPKTPLEPGRSPMADSVSRPKTPLEPGQSPMANSVSKPNRGDPALADTATPGTQRMPKQGGNDPAMADTQSAPRQGGPNAPNDPAAQPRTPAQKVDAVRQFSEERITAHNREVEAANRMIQDPSMANRQAYHDAVLAADKARVKEAGEWYKVGGDGRPPSQGSADMKPMPPVHEVPPLPGMETTQPASRTANLDPAMADTAAPGTQRMQPGEGGSADPARAPTQAQTPRNDAERIDAIKPYTDDRVAAQQRYKEAEARYDADSSQANYDALDQADAAYNRAHMQELEAWNRAGGQGFPPTKDAGIQRAEAAPAPARTPTQPGIGPEGAPGNLQMAEAGPKTQRGIGPGPTAAPMGTGTQAGLGPEPVQRSGNADPALADTGMAPPQPRVSPDNARRLDAIKPYTDDRVAAQVRYNEAEARYDADRSQANYDALDKANADYNRAHMRELDAWNQAGGQGFPPTREAALDPAYQPSIGFAQTGMAPAAQPAPDIAFAKPVATGMEGQSGANNTLAMGLANLTGIIQKGP